MDYIEVINQPIDVNIGASFIVSVDVLLVEVEDTFTLTFEIMSKGLYFADHHDSDGFRTRITKKFEYDTKRTLQQCKVQLVLAGEFKHFPIRTILRVSSPNSTPSNCKINIYNAIA